MDHPRVELVHGATPLCRLHRLSERLGVDLWIKRDDLAGTTLGGNKARQLEYYLGQARAAQADTVLITGAVQSNFARTAAASAAQLGMRTIVQLEDRVPGQGSDYETSGNVMVSRLYGAEIIRYPDGEDEAGADAALRARADAERAKGHVPYVIPLSAGNPPYGALGYVRAAREILEQDPTGFDHVVVGSGSGLTHAGLLSGLVQAGSRAKVIGSCVRRARALQMERMRGVLDATASLMGVEPVPDASLHIWDGALNPGYGFIGPMAANAMRLMARQEGILLDPVYTAKVFAAIPALIETGQIKRDARVLFLHTGGLAALFAYQSELSKVF